MSDSPVHRDDPLRPVPPRTFFDRRRRPRAIGDPMASGSPAAGPTRTPGSWLRGQLMRATWLALAVAFALGSAGAVAALQPPPDGTNRPELTWGADNSLSARLEAVANELVLLKGDVDTLGDQTRSALSALAQVDQASLTAAWNAGNEAIGSIGTRSSDLNQRLDCAGWNDAFQHALAQVDNNVLVDRYHEVCLAIASVAPLKADWEALVAGSTTAMQVAADIDGHDQAAAQALQLATQGRYPDALAQLSDATAKIDDATAIATIVGRVVDVSTLDSWLSRTSAMDEALATLWNAMIASNGRITSQVTTALRNVNDAKALLPDDNAVLAIVLHELAGNLTSSGISIETARGALSVAVADVVGETVGGQQ